MQALLELIDRWRKEAQELKDSHGYENHSRSCLMSRMVRELEPLIPGLDNEA